MRQKLLLLLLTVLLAGCTSSITGRLSSDEYFRLQREEREATIAGLHLEEDEDPNCPNVIYIDGPTTIVVQ